MGSNILKYVFIVIVIILIGFGVYKMLQNDKSNNNEIIDQTSTVSNIQTDLRLAICDFDTINPLLSNNRNVQEISKIIFEPLITLKEDYKMKYCLAEEIARIDEKNYVIKLRKGVLWHDGTLFTSNDVKFTVDTIKNGGINSIYSNNLQAVSELSKIDDYTIKISLAYPVDFFEYNLTFPILSEKYYSEQDFVSTEKNVSPIGTGLFEISSVDSNVIKLSKNNNYWDISRDPMSKEININLYNSAGELYNAFKNGEIDIVDVKISNIEEYIGSIGYKKIEYKSRDYDFMAFNTTNELFSDVAVRKAISKIIDKNNIVASCLGSGYVASNFSLDMGNWLYTKDLSVEPNAEEANQILTQAGWEHKNNTWIKKADGKTLKLEFSISVNGNNPTRIAVAENIKNQLANFGILVYVKQLNNEAYAQNIDNKKFDAIITGITCGYSPNLNAFFGQNNLAGYENSEVSKLMKENVNTSNDDTLYNNYSKLYDIYLEEAPYIGLYRNTDLVIYNQNFIGNIQANSFNLYYNIEKWYRQ